MKRTISQGKHVVRFTVREENRALPILLRHSPGMILPERTYVIADEAAQALRAAGIRFTELARESVTSNGKGDHAGERI